LPLRHLQYPGNLFWTEQGYRFSWRVMLMEKSGFTNFIVKDPKLNTQKQLDLADYLTPFQQQQMRSQPDMILQFAHFLRDKYEAEGEQNVEVYAKIQAKLNGRNYQSFVNKEIDLAQIEWSFFEHSDWIMEFENTKIKK
jgi:hypothetical protein